MASKFKTVVHDVDLCVVGGGMAGYGAALAAANHGAKVVLMHDRPMPGGNASSEVRMHICGADRHNTFPDMRETGLLEELRLLNARVNPKGSFGRWDTLLYEKLHFHPNITLLLNCSCMDAETVEGKVVSVTGWQIQSELFQTVKAKFFADCSGDGILAPLTGAEFRIGREAASEYDESLGQQVADDKTMGHSLLFSVKDTGEPCEFITPEWANKYPDCDDLPYGFKGHANAWFDGKINYWWLEKGGEHDTIGQTEYLRGELVKIIYGVWDHLKNHCENKDALKNYTIDWMEFMPAKRESRRYVGAYVLNQKDLEEGAVFPDAICHGGWTMDDHNPVGFSDNRGPKKATEFNQCKPGYSIPWRSLYSRNISNLLFAGRDASCTHMAMSSTRVMGTCLVMGEAVGVGVGLMLEKGLQTPELDDAGVRELQQRLLIDDVYVPGAALDKGAYMSGASFNVKDAALAIDGVSRKVDDDLHYCEIKVGEPFCCELAAAEPVSQIGLYLDSVLENADRLEFSWHYRKGYTYMPERLPKKYRVEVRQGDEWKVLLSEECNIRRHVWHKLGSEISGARLVVEELWGGGDITRLYGFYLK